jgi:beta-apo-4'-carotenal oxygenase
VRYSFSIIAHATVPVIMGDCKIPSLQYASTENIQNSVNKSRQAFLQHKTRDVEFRLLQLRRLYWA